MIPVVFSGEAGTRLWPVSREADPKHIKKTDGWRRSTEDSETVNQVYLVAVGWCISFNDFFEAIRNPLGPRVPYVKGTRLHHGDFGPGDVRHFIASIT